MYIKDAIEAVLLMIVRSLYPLLVSVTMPLKLVLLINGHFFSQENPARANGQIFNVGNPNNEVTVRQLAEVMINVCDAYSNSP